MYVTKCWSQLHNNPNRYSSNINNNTTTSSEDTLYNNKRWSYSSTINNWLIITDCSKMGWLTNGRESRGAGGGSFGMPIVHIMLNYFMSLFAYSTRASDTTAPILVYICWSVYTTNSYCCRFKSYPSSLLIYSISAGKSMQATNYWILKSAAQSQHGYNAITVQGS